MGKLCMLYVYNYGQWLYYFFNVKRACLRDVPINYCSPGMMTFSSDSINM